PGRLVVVVTGAVEVVVTAAVVIVVDGNGRVVTVVGGSFSRLATERVDSSGERGQTMAAPTARADTPTTEISRRRRDGDFGGEGSNTAYHFGQPGGSDLPTAQTVPATRPLRRRMVPARSAHCGRRRAVRAERRDPTCQTANPTVSDQPAASCRSREG